jgi:hypothetical protein
VPVSRRSRVKNEASQFRLESLFPAGVQARCSPNEVRSDIFIISHFF